MPRGGGGEKLKNGIDGGEKTPQRLFEESCVGNWLSDWLRRDVVSRSLRVVVSKICEDMLVSRQQQQLRFPPKHLFYHWRCRLEMATTIRGQFRASKTARAVVHNTKRSLAASFARDTPPCSSDLQLLMNLFYCWRHSRLA